MHRIAGLILITTLILLMLTIPVVYAEGEEVVDKGWYAIGAAIAMGLSAIGAGYGIAHAGAAAMGAIAEKPETATWGLIIVALAEGLALYGLIIAFLIVAKI